MDFEGIHSLLSHNSASLTSCMREGFKLRKFWSKFQKFTNCFFRHFYRYKTLKNNLDVTATLPNERDLGKYINKVRLIIRGTVI